MTSTNTLKLSLNHADGVWCEEIVVPEMKLLENDDEDDHLVLHFDQSGRDEDKRGCQITVYISCVPKGKVHMPFTLRELQQKVTHSKVKLYHAKDLDLQVRHKNTT